MNTPLGLTSIHEQYSISKLIHESLRSIIFLGSNADNEAVTIKVLKSRLLRPLDIAILKEEYKKIISLEHEGLLRTLDIVEYDSRPALILEYFEGRSLRKCISDAELPIPRFLSIAAGVARALAALHQVNIIHRNLTPNSILLDNGTIKITNFGINRHITRGEHEIYTDEAVLELFPYISPEQTGRINRSVDQRSDLYSLGTVLYEMLTGSPPFSHANPLEIFHAHIAQPPVAPDRINAAIPKIVSDIVCKLLEKTPDDRYQSAYGLLHDITLCREAIESGGTGPYFTLGTKDVSYQFTLPQGLIGRDREMERLDSLYRGSLISDDSGGGSVQTVLVHGAPGIGKTVLVGEFQRRIISRRGLFISGGNDELHKDIPYHSVRLAFQELVSMLLMEREDHLTRWKNTILRFTGNNGGVLIEFIPELTHIIGDQPEPVELSGVASQNRFNTTVIAFIRSIIAMGQPLVLCLDDIQWADRATINLVQYITENFDSSRLLLILAFRDFDMARSPHAEEMVAAILERESVHPIHLEPFSLEDTERYLCDFLRTDRVEIQQISQFMFQKSRGNPFFINQLLQTAYNNNYIVLNESTGWQWDMQKIQKMQFPSDVSDLVVERITLMNGSSKEILSICSCFGKCIKPEEVASVANMDIDLIISLFNTYENEGLLESSENLYSFTHDRIAEASYSLLSREEKERIHYSIGIMLLKSVDYGELDEVIITIANHLNLGINCIASGLERLLVKEINIAAAKKSKQSTAYESSLHFITAAVELADGDCWRTDYESALYLYASAAEYAFLSGNYDAMNRWGDAVLENGASLLHKIKIHELVIESCYAQNRIMDGLAKGLALIRKLGYPLPRHPGMIHVVWELIRLKISLLSSGIGKLTGLQDMDNDRMLAMIRAMNSIGVSAYKSIPLIVPIIALRCVRLSLRHGISPETPYALAAYGMILCGALGDIDSGVAIGSVANELNSRQTAERLRARTMHLIYCMIWHWKNHIRSTLDAILNASKLALETGDLENATSSMHVNIMYSFLAGDPLQPLMDRIDTVEATIRHYRQMTNLNYLLMLKEAVRGLMNSEIHPGLLVGDSYDETAMVPVHLKANDNSALCILNIYKTMINCFVEQYDYAAICSQESKGKINTITGIALAPVLYMYDSIARIRLMRTPKRRRVGALRREVYKNCKRLRTWARHAPMNHQHRLDLVKAEMRGASGKIGEAEELYGSAIAGAGKNGYVQDEALANKLAAQFYLQQGNIDSARKHMERAYRLFNEWGAASIAFHIEMKYGDLIRSAPAPFPEEAGSEHRDRLQAGAVTLDFYSVINALQVISGEIKLANLLTSIIRIMIRNAGAQRCVLMLMDAGNVEIKAEGSALDDDVTIYDGIPLDEYSDIPHSLVNYVRRSGETAVLDDAAHSGIFISDPYIKRNSARSILCMPLSRQGAVKCIMYFENSLTAGTFDIKRLETLHLLSTQAAISIENSLFYEKTLHAEREIQDQYEKIQNQYAEMESINEELEQTHSELENTYYDLTKKTELLEIFRKLAETSGQGLAMTDLNGTITYANTSFCTLVNAESQEVLIGKGIADIYPAAVRDDMTLRNFRKVLECGQLTMELPILSRGNDTIPTIQNIFLIKNNLNMPVYLGFIITDISELKLSAEILRQSEERYRVLVETMSEGLCMVDSAGNFDFVNQSLCRMLGYDKEELIHRPVSHFLDTTNRLILQNQLERRRMGEKNAYELQWIKKNGSSIITIVSPQLILDSNSNVTGSFSVISDITERRKNEVERIRMKEQLLQAQKMEAIGTLAGGIAHDFNNQLTAILGYGQMLLSRTADDDASSQEIREIIKAADRSASLTRQLLAFSRRQLLNPFTINLNGIVSDMGNMLRRLIGEDIELIMELENDLDCINADQSQVEQILMNLAVNALDAMSQGGKLTIKTANIRLDAAGSASIADSRPGKYVRLSVIDNGQGIPLDIVENIFEPFFTTKETGKGTGLGLSVVYGIIKQHNGWINVTSEP
ncbi:MAG: PAS domain S-box protein, partial [Spirochaetes bacterium]|nr:PAS domain S-box protein [Spirochaetota bacterium]